MPQIDPFVVPNVNPAGTAGLISQDVISPGPLRVADIGRLELAVLLTSVKFCGEYDSEGN